MAVDIGTVSSWVAAAISAASAGIAWWKSWYERPTPEWVLDPIAVDFSIMGAMARGAYGARTGPRDQATAVLVNVGDGTALNVTVTSTDCAAVFATEEASDPRPVTPKRRVAQIPPAGETVVAVLPDTTPAPEDGSDLVMRQLDQPVDRQTIRVTLEWTERPARARKRRARTILVDGDGLRFEDDAPTPAAKAEEPPTERQD